MSRFLKYIFSILSALALLTSCEKEVELITDSTTAEIESFQLYDQRNLSVSVGNAVINSDFATVHAVIKGGSDIKNLKPWSNVSLDAYCSPKMGVWTDFSSPVKYTLVAGDKKTKKIWTINVTVQQ